MNQTTPLQTLYGAALMAALACSSGVHAADATVGQRLFDKTCVNCHSTQAGVNKVGPTLFDIVDRPVASVQGYDYSASMRAASKQWRVWDTQRLDGYLSNPRQVLHGVKMFSAVPDAKDRADVLAYLSTLK
jgi:cytochrome c